MGFMDDYEPVEERLRQFWTDYPTGRIVTKLLSHDLEGDYVVQASIWRTDDADAIAPAATGMAHDAARSLPNNMKASALEVCETSAIGRALANLGYAPKGKRPSREEMEKAKRGAGGGNDAPRSQGDPSTPARPARRPNPTPSAGGADRETSGGESGVAGEDTSGNNAPGVSRTTCTCGGKFEQTGLSFVCSNCGRETS